MCGGVRDVWRCERCVEVWRGVWRGVIMSGNLAAEQSLTTVQL